MEIKKIKCISSKELEGAKILRLLNDYDEILLETDKGIFYCEISTTWDEDYVHSQLNLIREFYISDENIYDKYGNPENTMCIEEALEYGFIDEAYKEEADREDTTRWAKKKEGDRVIEIDNLKKRLKELENEGCV